MGVDAGDFDDDGDEDVFVTNLSGEGHDLYVNDSAGNFEPRNASSGLKHPSLPFTGFGTAWVDIDNDGALDVLTVNGTMQRIDALIRENDPMPLRQRKQLFRNLGTGRFEDVTSRSGPVFERADVGRGVRAIDRGLSGQRRITDFLHNRVRNANAARDGALPVVRAGLALG